MGLLCWPRVRPGRLPCGQPVRRWCTAGQHAPEVLAVEDLQWSGEVIPAVIQTLCAAARNPSAPPL